MFSFEEQIRVLGLCHGDRVDDVGPTTWYCRPCRAMVPDEHTCNRSLKEHVQMTEEDLGIHSTRPISRRNRWVDESSKYEVPEYGDGFEVGNDEHRYMTVRYWKDPADGPLNLVGFILIAPEAAYTSRFHGRLNRVMRFARGWGYDGVLVGYAYSIIVRNHDHIKRGTKIVGGATNTMNELALQTLAGQCSRIVVAWGRHMQKDRILDLLEGALAQRRLYAVSKSTTNVPIDPWRADTWAQPVPWSYKG